MNSTEPKIVEINFKSITQASEAKQPFQTDETLFHPTEASVPHSQNSTFKMPLWIKIAVGSGLILLLATAVIVPAIVLNLSSEYRG